MKIPEILFLEPNRVWRTYPGGKKLDILEGVENPKDSHFPEDWIGSTTRAVNKGREHLTEEGLSQINNNGNTISLKDLCEKEPLSILGSEHFEKYGANTQFLLKFLDSAIRLHIQCHPTIPFAQKFLNSNSGKTEAYVILGIREEVKQPYIYMGFQHPPKKEDFKRMIVDQDTSAILACFEKIPIKPGDVFMVPGGMPHAIGEGVFMIEIMEPTDFAVRIEFERCGYVLPEESRFMNKGIDFALSMFDYSAISIEDIKKNFFCESSVLETQNKSAEYVLIDDDKTSCFKVKRLKIKDRFIKESDSFYIGVVSSGSGEIRIKDEVFQLKQGIKFFVPYKTGSVEFISKSGMEIIITFPPK
ncbi:class I mannose-6-phosphate isomerase [Marinilabilia sp.]